MEENCPMCSNHCPKNNLSYGRGREYFNGNKNLQNESKPNTIEEQVIEDLRACGHILHHGHDLDSDKILSNLNKDEIKKLHELLSKVIDN